MEWKRWRPAAIMFGAIAAVIIPTIATLLSVKDPGKLYITSANPTPYGYTISLLLFIIPMLFLIWWLVRHPKMPFQKKAFVRTLLLLLPLGFVLDYAFGSVFFYFPNPGATLEIFVTDMTGGKLPVEEFVFYLTGFVTVLLLYVWCDEYWMAAYNPLDYKKTSMEVEKLLHFHWLSIGWGVGLIVLAVLYKWLFSEWNGFPWYFTYLVAASFIPSAGLFCSTRRFINWRAFSFVFFFILLISLIWEATLASPYGWWRYHDEAMMGVYIGAWNRLPVEAVMVWMAVTYTTVIIFEAVKIWVASGKGLKEACLGDPSIR